MNNPLFDGVVTVYRPNHRQVVTDCHYRWEQQQAESPEGLRRKTVCRLYVTGKGYFPQIGDRIYPGEGPEQINWEMFLPVNVEGLSQIDWVRPCYLFGELHHVEAGC